jgi:hypothetical protein
MNRINKGYTLTVVSWENDADYYQTKSKTVDTLEEAKVWYEMMQLCKSKNNQPKGVIMLGNTYGGFDEQQEEVAKEFMKKYHKILIPDDDIEEDAELSPVKKKAKKVKKKKAAGKPTKKATSKTKKKKTAR